MSAKPATPLRLLRCANGDGEVTINEIIVGVNIALETASASACVAVDANSDGAVTINELIAAVNQALNDCSSGPPPTPTPTPGTGSAGRLVFLWTDQSTFMGDIVTIEPDGSARTNLTNTAALSEGQPSWSPTGDRIVFTIDNTAVAVMNADGSNITRITNDAVDNSRTDWSAHDVIAFGSFATEVLNSDGTGQRQLLADGGFPGWSATGDRFAYSGFNGLGYANADGSGVMTVPNTDSNDTDPDIR